MSANQVKVKLSKCALAPHNSLPSADCQKKSEWKTGGGALVGEFVCAPAVKRSRGFWVLPKVCHSFTLHRSGWCLPITILACCMVSGSANLCVDCVIFNGVCVCCRLRKRRRLPERRLRPLRIRRPAARRLPTVQRQRQLLLQWGSRWVAQCAPRS